MISKEVMKLQVQKFIAAFDSLTENQIKRQPTSLLIGNNYRYCNVFGLPWSPFGLLIGFIDSVTSHNIYVKDKVVSGPNYNYARCLGSSGLSLVRIIEEIFQGNSGSGLENRN
jgi:hypothetical protein